MVSILNNQTSNEEFLEFATNEVHNVDVATTHHGAPSLQDIINIETWCNSLPRKILAYHTPDEIFERELDHIYQAA